MWHRDLYGGPSTGDWGSLSTRGEGRCESAVVTVLVTVGFVFQGKEGKCLVPRSIQGGEQGHEML